MTTILITGASSGIGAALARAYAAAGSTLVLWGRNAERLDGIAGECRSRGAEVEVAAFDITDIDGMLARLNDLDRRRPLDLAYLNAGIGGEAPAGQPAEDAAGALEIATVNFTAPVVGATALANRMAGRGRGHIVLMSSVAGSFPLPMAPTYSGSKAGLSQFGEALALRLRRHGVRVTLVSPGFIDTPMSRQLVSPKPFMIDAEAAAAIIVRKVAASRARFVVPWPFAAIRAVAGVLPKSLTRAVLRRL